MKKQKITLLMTLTISALLFTACGAAGNTQTTQPQGEAAEETQAAQTETQEAAAKETESPETEIRETEISSAEAEDQNGPQKMQFTVDVTDNLAAKSGIIVGNTSSNENYCGIIEIHLDEALAEKAASEIQTGNSYVFTVEPMMTMSMPPQVVATDFTPASEEDLRQLEEIRKTISNYKECMESYENMALDEILQDANFNYALWTQDEIAEFQDFIAEKGYTEDSGVKSYVKIRSELDGSISGASE